jgi:hypothetical protein
MINKCGDFKKGLNKSVEAKQNNHLSPSHALHPIWERQRKQATR